VVGQAQVVVGAEVQHRAAVGELDLGRLRAGDDAFGLEIRSKPFWKSSIGNWWVSTLPQREAAQHQLGHLVPGLVHLPAVDAVDGEALEDDLVPVGAGALGHDPEHRDLAAVVHAVEHVVEGARVAAHFQAHVEALPCAGRPSRP
jgi:hypothetical protein